MVVMTPNSRRGSPGSIPRKSEIYYLLLSHKWCVEGMGEGDHEVMCGEHQLSVAE